ncbi:AraC family transcriptional regulator [Bordetella flabilis]|uniref:AraC family transcriptional regulator n=1 Tax=Bordetella flabilis TaxID=463014 RepID=A0A193GC37_9BORD|nr:AraC family transcriptional regulator [Bordetella flabilis]ANN76839.1 AraC family transcriptional regulator [Bordetella flabilis]
MLQRDWLSQLLDMMTVTGQLEIRCAYGAPWRIAQGPSRAGDIPYHVVLSGTAVLEDPRDGSTRQLGAGDILLLPHGSPHLLHDGSGRRPSPARDRAGACLTVSENAGKGARLDMLCGRIFVAPPNDRLVRDYLPASLVVPAAMPGQAGASLPPAHLSALVGLMQAEAHADTVGGYAMLNALSCALFTLVLRAASEAAPPMGLLALAGQPRLAPALSAMFADPAKPWTLPELAGLCSMSRATFMRRFQDKLGRSAYDLLTDIRMSRAAEALKNPAISTEAVAAFVGYQSVAAFRRAFAGRMGMTPGQWRRGVSPPPAVPSLAAALA